MKKKVALVLGGNGGIGSSAVKRLVQDGFHVCATFHKNRDQIDKIKASLNVDNLTEYKCNALNGVELNKTINDIISNFGEIDVFSNLEFKKNNRVITLANINLTHTGYSQRDWVTAKGRDLYKGNGRMRQETHIIQQGPFQAIHYDRYQSSDFDTKKNYKLYDFDGKDHSHIYIFRNSKMIGGKKFEEIIIKDLDRKGRRGAKEECFLEFLEFLEGKRKRKEMTSDFLTHREGSLITSIIYESIVSQYKNKNAKIKIKIKQ